MATTMSLEAWNPISDARVTGKKLLLQQFNALILKNLLLSYYRRLPTTLHLTSSFIFILLIFGVDKSIQSRRRASTAFKNLHDPPPIRVTAIPPCETGFFIKQPCYDFVFSGNSSARINLIISNIMQNNPGRPIPSSKVIGFNSIDDVNRWLLKNPLRCTGAIHMEERSASVIAYGIQTNSTSKQERGVYEDPVFKFQLPLQLAAEREIFRVINGGGSIEWTVSFKEFAHPPLEVGSFVGMIAPTFLLAASMFGFVIQMSDIIAEKELKLRQAMSIMGMSDITYWASWVLWEIFLAFLSSLFLVIFGLMFQFYLFLHNSFGLLLCVFFFFQVNLIGFGYMLSTFISKTASAKTVGFCVFIVGFITQIVTFFGFPYDGTFSKVYWIIWSFFPPNLLAIALFYLSEATKNQNYPGISWSGRKVCSYGQPKCVLTMENILGWMVGTFLLWLCCAIYLDNVLPDLNGVRLPWYYVFQRSYWTGKREESHHDVNKHTRRLSSYQILEDEDVKAEEADVQRAMNGNINNSDIAVQVRGLVKTYMKKGTCCKKRTVFHAVKGLWINIQKNSLLCLLGQNGAGKTTSISCMTGVLPITDGDVSIYGDSVKSAAGMSNIRRCMGVCPQFDILWDTLSGLQHLYIFGCIKGLHTSHIRKHSLELLERVKLSEAANVAAGNYSGGMKRRLSVAIALIGDPKFVCLDEPTTGMDPVTRRHVWSVIEGAKSGRAIILTTHSMEEADILGDRIAIMAKGVLRCIGTSVRLKSRLGEGYIVTVKLVEGYRRVSSAQDTLNSSGDYKHLIKQSFKEALDVNIKQESNETLTFIVPHEKEEKLAVFFEELQKIKDDLKISDINVSLTTLEKVFLKVTMQAEIEAAQREGRSEIVKVSDGRSVKVSVGAPVAYLPDGTAVKLEWQQDETGKLYAEEILEADTSLKNPQVSSASAVSRSMVRKRSNPSSRGSTTSNNGSRKNSLNSTITARIMISHPGPESSGNSNMNDVVYEEHLSPPQDKVHKAQNLVSGTSRTNESTDNHPNADTTSHTWVINTTFQEEERDISRDTNNK